MDAYHPGSKYVNVTLALIFQWKETSIILQNKFAMSSLVYFFTFLTLHGAINPQAEFLNCIKTIKWNIS